MRLLIFTILAFTTLVVAYAVGIGGMVGGLMAIAVLLIGVGLHVTQPIIDWATKP